jgi:hypothetical protein
MNEPAQKINYVFVDHENVPLDAIDQVDHEYVRLILFVGAQQKKLPIEAVIAIQKFGTRAEWIQVSGTAANALDFHIAFYLGRLAHQDQKAYFHIISKDKGYDPLIAHLREQKILANRCENFGALPFVQRAAASDAKSRAKAYVEHLAKPMAPRPAKVQTLRNSINALFMKQLSDAELADVVSELVRLKVYFVEGTKATPLLPKA